MSGNWLKMSGTWLEWMWIDGSGCEHVLQIFLLIAPPFAGLSKVRYVLVNVYYVLFSLSNHVYLCLKIGYQFIDSRFKSRVNCLRFTDLICRHKSYLQTSAYMASKIVLKKRKRMINLKILLALSEEIRIWIMTMGME